MTSLSRKWPWPDSLDAVAAAPENHVVLFENDRVHVLENVGTADLRVIAVELKQ